MQLIPPELLINAYSQGIFPMAENDGTIYWYGPDPRAIIPLETYKPPKSLRPIINKKYFEMVVNRNFEQVIRNCAAPRDEDDTWISEEIILSYIDLHRAGFAHSVEAYYEGELVGGLYGVAINGVFCGESMFYKMPNASKVAFYYLIEILKHRGFCLLDTQFINDNVQRYGAIEIRRTAYLKKLQTALQQKVSFVSHVGENTLAELLA